MVLVTHDLGVVAGRADDIAVMYAGKVVEKAPTSVLFSSTRHPYTEALLKSIPKLEHTSHTRLDGHPRAAARPGLAARGLQLQPPLPVRPAQVLRGGTRARARPGGGHEFACWYPGGHAGGGRGPGPQRGEAAAAQRRGRLMAGTGTAHLRDPSETILRAENLVVEFPVGRTGLKVHAVSGISLDVKEGETLGLVGESGCGKSTTGRALMQFPSPPAARSTFEGEELTALHGEDLRHIRTRMQMIFQDPISSLNPRRKVGDIVSEPLAIWSEPARPERGAPDHAGRHPVLRDRRRSSPSSPWSTSSWPSSCSPACGSARATLGPITIKSAAVGLLHRVRVSGRRGRVPRGRLGIWRRDPEGRTEAITAFAAFAVLGLVAWSVIGVLDPRVPRAGHRSWP